MKLVAPEGFSVSGRDEVLIVSDVQRESVVAAGFDRLETWRRHLDRGEVRSGRGSTARVSLESGAQLRIKQLRRGGLLEALWRDRFAGSGRLIDNLRVPLIARSRGISTPEPVALMLAQGPPGLFRGWIAFEELVGAINLTAAITAGPTPTPEERQAVMSLVRRMHDSGVEHRDLNLGNLMMRRTDRPTQVFVIDLDRARVSATPLAFAKRQQALRRLERSFVKETGRRDGTDWIYDDYAGDETGLQARLGRGRALGRRLLDLHRR
jgi:tRNA A-37 threonylcarbamoyl transferase component Bud32